ASSRASGGGGGGLSFGLPDGAPALAGGHAARAAAGHALCGAARALAGGGLRGVRPAARLPAPALRGCVRRGRARQLPRRGRAPADPDQRRPHARGVAGRVPRHEPAG
ncbi:unnamed protein product, partial [Prorocentrum cordatum]